MGLGEELGKRFLSAMQVHISLQSPSPAACAYLVGSYAEKTDMNPEIKNMCITQLELGITDVMCTMYFTVMTFPPV